MSIEDMTTKELLAKKSSLDKEAKGLLDRATTLSLELSAIREELQLRSLSLEIALKQAEEDRIDGKDKQASVH
jgi:hypothetical protein